MLSISSWNFQKCQFRDISGYLWWFNWFLSDMSWFWRFTKIWTTSWMKVHSSTSTENLWQNMLIGITTEISDSDHQLFSSTFLTLLDKYLSFWQTCYQQNLHWTKIFLSSVIFNVWHKSQIAACTLFFPLPAKQCTGRSVQTSWKLNK